MKNIFIFKDKDMVYNNMKIEHLDITNTPFFFK